MLHILDNTKKFHVKLNKEKSHENLGKIAKHILDKNFISIEDTMVDMYCFVLD